jgi:uncharacterized membrane protein YfcA
VTVLDSALLFLAAAGGGALNSVAGGGSFLTFPTLLFMGVPAVTANATSTVALWPGSVASASAYRRDLATSRRYLVSYGLVSLLGGWIGARLLLRTPDGAFREAVPWLLLFATLVFAFGASLVARLRRQRDVEVERPEGGASLAAVLVQLAIAVYGGFFGGGIGIMMLAAFAVLGMRNIHAMNGMKNLLGACINGVAVATFVAAGAVSWPPALVMLGGSILGGYGGAAGARRLNPLLIRRFVIALGFGLSAYFFVAG